MSYAGKDPRSRRTASGTTGGSVSTRVSRGDSGERVLDRQLSITSRGVASPTGSRPANDDHELDWQHITIFAVGALLGVTIGAGAALLFAPQSGARTRHNLARRGRHLRTRTTDAWDDLRHELRYATRRSRRKLARKLDHALRDRRERRALNADAVGE
jgi:gas vesicle protein